MMMDQLVNVFVLVPSAAPISTTTTIIATTIIATSSKTAALRMNS